MFWNIVLELGSRSEFLFQLNWIFVACGKSESMRTFWISRKRGPLHAAIVAVALVGLVSLGRGFTTDANGYYDWAAKTGQVNDSSNGNPISFFGTATSSQWNGPQQSGTARFVVGLEATTAPKTPFGNTFEWYGVQNIHIKVSGTDPNGNLVSKLVFSSLQTWQGPNQNAANLIPVAQYLYNTISPLTPTWAQPFANTISNLVTYSQSSPSPTGNDDDYSAYGDWTGCSPSNDYCYNPFAASLVFAFVLSPGGSLPGIWALTLDFHVVATACIQDTSTGTCFVSTQSSDLYDHVYYCFQNCNGFWFFDSQSQPIALQSGGPAVNDGITIIASGFNPSPVQMSATTTDSAITTSFNPSSVTLTHSGPADNPQVAGVTTLSISLAPNSCKTGSFTVTATAGSNGLLYSIPIQITEPCEFSISSSQPNPSTITAGGSSTSTVSLSSQGLSGNVQLSSSISSPSCASSCPTISFSPNPAPLSSTGSATSAMTVFTSATTTTGSYSVTITGTGSPGGIFHSTTISFQVTSAPPDFSISANPTSTNVVQGTPGTSTITVGSLNTFSGNVALSANAPAGFSATVNPITVSLSSGGTAASTLTVSVNGAPSAGTYIVTVTGSSGTLSHSVNVQVSYPGDFSISASPSSVTAGSTATITVSSINGLAGTVSLSETVWPSKGLTCTLSSSSIALSSTSTSGTSILFCSGSSGTYTVTVTGTDGSLTHSTQVTVGSGNLLANPGFETGDFTGWTQTGAMIRTDAASVHTGLYAAAPSYNSATGIYSAFTLQQNLPAPVAANSISTISLWYRWGTSADSVQILYTDGTYTQTNLPFIGGTYTLVNVAFDSTKTISGIKVVRTSGQTNNINLDDFLLQGAVNQLANPGFETGDFTGWSQTGACIRTDTASVHTGLYAAAPCYNSSTLIYSAFTLQQNLPAPVAANSISTISLWYRWGTSADSVRVLYTDGTYTQTNLPYIGSTYTLVNAGFDSTKTISGIEVVRTSGQTNNINLDDFVLQVTSSGGGGGSVAAGTRITLADGTQVPVQSLKVGMQLLSYDMTTHQYVITTITKFVTVMTYNQMVISTSAGKPLIVDQNSAQKLYVKTPDGTVALMPVTDLKVGYELFDASSQTWVPITSIHYENGGNHLMYDIYTTSPGNYIANGYLDPLKM